MILIYPPIAKPGQPPSGIAKLFYALSAHGIDCTLVDANLEGLLYLLNHAPASQDNWSQIAQTNLQKNLRSVRSNKTYENIDNYKRIVRDLNRVLDINSKTYNTKLTLANFQHQELMPVNSADLIKAAEKPELNPFYPYFKSRILPLIEQKKPKAIGISLVYLGQALCTFALVGFLRKECPDLKIILGGGLITSWMSHPQWNNPFVGLVDECVSGAGEQYLLSLFDKVAIKKEHYRPDYTTLPKKDYLSPGFVLPYSASNGCYWQNCTFCPERAEKNPYEPIAVKQVRQDLDIMIRQTDPTLIHLLDNAISPALLRCLCEQPLPVPWYGYVRFEKHLEDPDFCLALRRSGCVMLQLGLESGDQNVLDQMHKGITLESVTRILNNLKSAGIGTFIYLLFGTPYETIVEARRTMEYVVQQADKINYINPSIFNLPIYSDDAKQLQTRDFYDGDLSLYTDFFHPKGWDRMKIRRFFSREFKRHPAVANIIRKTPPIFKVNHSPFFLIRKNVNSEAHLAKSC